MEKWIRANYQPNVPLGEDGTRVTGCDAHIALARQAAADGMVLLKNENNVLPLASGTRVALFGKATFDYVQGGGGSGEVFSRYTRNLYEGLKQKENRVEIFEPLAEFYRDNVQRQLGEGALPGLTQEPCVPQHLLADAVTFTDTAILSICRFSGEGWDRKSEGASDADRLWDNIDTPAMLAAKLFEEGDFCLSQAEQQMVQCVVQHFSKVVVVLNVGGIVDSSWFCDHPGIKGALLAWAAGMEGGLAIADILLGDVNPSGKLADTMAKTLEDYPSTCSFHASSEYVDYTEDIYVGYRYFETLPDADKKVNYPFGFGLSYTDFEIEEQGMTQANCQLEFWVSVKNTGNTSGREVVQLYCKAPKGNLGKPARVLVGFVKTNLLLPGETQRIKICVSYLQMASFDDIGAVHMSSFVLEKGTYYFYLGNSVHAAQKTRGVYVCKKNQVVQHCAKKLTPCALSLRMKADGSKEQLEITASSQLVNALKPLSEDEMECKTPVVEYQTSKLFVQRFKKDAKTLFDVARNAVTLDDFMAQLTDEELARLLGGQPNTGVGITFGLGNLPDYGVPNVMTTDGPAGVRIQPWTQVFTTAWPCATALACTWDESLIARVGKAGAMEVKENNMYVWLTPAVNIHRSPLCGRNFEYYSEDPFLTGTLAAAMVRGIQSQHIAACVKHFAFNNKETNRKHSDSRVSERAAREIYLKAFEIIVKEADPWCMMSSYNLVNGCHCAQNKELLEDILRTEWGFDGLVVTDWWGYSEQYLEILSGNDVKMGLGYPERLLEAMQKRLIARQDLLCSVRRLLQLLLKLD